MPCREIGKEQSISRRHSLITFDTTAMGVTGRFLDAPYRTSSDGIEQTLAVNYWGHVYLTLMLLDRIIDSKPARIINMVSAAEALDYFDPDDVTGE